MKKIATLLILCFMFCTGVSGIISTASLAYPATVQAAVDNPYLIRKPEALPTPAADAARLRSILTIVFTIIGAISLLMFTIGGLRYVTSQGDPQATAKAKGTLIYALVGLTVAISAVSIVTFVLGSL